MDAAYRKRRTIYCELVRSVSAGFLEAGSGTLFLLIAIRHFSAGPGVKGLLASGSSIGNLVSPFLVLLFQAFGFRASRAASGLILFSSAALFFAASSNEIFWFAGGIVLASAAFGSTVPFLAQVYQENYPKHERGRILSKVASLRILIAVFAALGGGWLLQGKPENFPICLNVIGILMVFSAAAMLLCPADAAIKLKRRELLVGVHALRTQKTFQVSILGWMLVGLGSFLILPLRTEYLSNSRYGVNLSEFEVAALVIGVPNVGKFLLYPFWGKLFDKKHFSTVRVIANFTSLFSILTFFTSDSLVGLILGSFMQGVAMAGGEITWTLWTTRLGEGTKVASLTGVHTFFTGVRGVIGPQLGFHLAESSSPMVVALVGGSLILSSVAVFIIEGKMEAEMMIEPN